MAGAATSLAGLATAGAKIHYSGPVNSKFKGTLNRNFPLENAASLAFAHNDLGRAHLDIAGAFLSTYFAGTRSFSSVSGFPFYLYRPDSHMNVSQQRFGHSCFMFFSTYGGSTVTYCFGGLIGFPGGHFNQPGRGFIGFAFNTGAGRQYGWVWVKTTGAGDYNFIVLDYAWGDPGPRGENSLAIASRPRLIAVVPRFIAFFLLSR